MVFPGEHVSSLLRYRGQRRTKEMILPSPGWWSNEFTGVSDRSKGRDAYKNTRASQQILSPAWATTHKTASLETPRQAAKPAKSPTLPARSQQWPIAYVTYLGGEVIKHRDYRPLTHLQHGHDRELSGATPKAQVCHRECGLLKLGQGPGSIFEIVFPWKHTNGTNSSPRGSLFIGACLGCCYKWALQ